MKVLVVVLAALFLCTFLLLGSEGAKPASPMVLVNGGTFRMGDVFGEGGENERPVHQVTLDSFLISKYEVTIAQFRAFVDATGYRTSAEHPENPDGFKKGWGGGERPKTEAERYRRHYQVLKESDGTAVWDPEKNGWIPYPSNVNWKSPRVAQTEQDPVVAVSWDDAASYCNWLSRQEGLAVAYDLENGRLLDASGHETTDTRAVRGYRLPTEAEWEYAAREGGRDVRFGTGQNTARSSEIVFRADAGNFPYLEAGENRKRTLPVGSLRPNALGLFDMSGNAWEWTSDDFVKYPDGPQTNPYAVAGEGEVRLQVLRGGRWGGDASEARVFSRSPFLRNDRCNNSGFRIARTR